MPNVKKRFSSAPPTCKDLNPLIAHKLVSRDYARVRLESGHAYDDKDLIWAPPRLARRYYTFEFNWFFCMGRGDFLRGGVKNLNLSVKNLYVLYFASFCAGRQHSTANSHSRSISLSTTAVDQNHPRGCPFNPLCLSWPCRGLYSPVVGNQDAERLFLLDDGGGGGSYSVVLSHPLLLPKLQVRSTVWIRVNPTVAFSVNPKDFTAFISWSGGWIRLLILIPGAVSLSALFIGYRRIQCIVLMAAPSLRGRCVDIHLNDGTFRIVSWISFFWW
jgi:hypothetical protein